MERSTAELTVGRSKTKLIVERKFKTMITVEGLEEELTVERSKAQLTVGRSKTKLIVERKFESKVNSGGKINSGDRRKG